MFQALQKSVTIGVSADILRKFGGIEKRRFGIMNKKRKSILRTLAACSLSAAMLVSSGCGKAGEPKQKIAVIGKQQLSFWDDVKKGAMDAGNELGYDIIYTVAENDNDYTSQVADIKNAILQDAKAIVIAPNSETELNDALAEAESKGIKIININSRAKYDGVTSLVFTDDQEGGALAARSAVKIFKKDGRDFDKLGKVAVIGHTAATADGRIEGFKSVIASQVVRNSPSSAGLDDEKLGAKIGAFHDSIIEGERCGTQEAAKEEALKVLRRYGNTISLMYGTNTVTTLGICDAVSELDLSQDIVVVGFNSDEKELSYIKTGVLNGTVVQNPYIMGYVGVRYAKRVLDGTNVPVELDTGSVFVDAGNMNDDYIQLALYPKGKDGGEN